MKIAYIVGSISPSEMFIRREQSALEELGHTAILYTVADPPPQKSGKLDSAFSCAPFDTRSFFEPRAWREFLSGYATAKKIAADAHAEKIQHLHAHFSSMPAAVAMMASKMSGIPFTFSAHARDIFVERSAILKKVEAAQGVAVCTQAGMKELQKYLPQYLHAKLRLIHHGVRMSKYKYLERTPSMPAKVLAVGRFIEKKGFSVLLAAAKELPAEISFEIVGSGKLENKLKKEIATAGLEPRVKLPGWLKPDDLRELMNDADLIVAPSIVARDGDRDGIPNILIEAAALGLPIVASDAGGIPELIDEKTGRLVPQNNPAALAAAIKAAIENPEETRARAKAARIKIEMDFNLRENVRKLTKLMFNEDRPITNETPIDGLVSDED